MIPKNLNNLRGFLGMIGYYRKFVWNYGRIEVPLTTLMKNIYFLRPPRQLKEAMCKAHVLATLDFTKTFIVECDASGNGIGAVLMQEVHPLSFTSHPIKGKNLKNPIYEKEMLEILHALKKWFPYLIERHFKVKLIMISLDNSWNKGYLQKRKKMGENDVGI